MDSQVSNAQLHSVDDETEVFIQNCNGTEDDLKFDQIVGALQTIVLEPEFIQLQQNFMRTHCLIFDNKQQNKMEYTAIFNKYQTEIEKYILNNLKQRVAGFSMEIFSSLLQTRNDHIDQQLLEMINSFGDFSVFKQLMLQYKNYYAQQQKFQALCIKGTVVSKKN